MVESASVLVGSTSGGSEGRITDQIEAPVNQAPPERPLNSSTNYCSTKRLRLGPAPSSPLWTPASAHMDCARDSTYGGSSIQDVGATGAMVGEPTRSVDPAYLARKISSAGAGGFVGVPSKTPTSGWSPTRADAAEDAMDVTSSSGGRPLAISGPPPPSTAPSPQPAQLAKNESSGYQSPPSHSPSSSASQPDGLTTAAPQGPLAAWPVTGAGGSRLCHTSLAHEAPLSTPLSVSPPLNDSPSAPPPPQPAAPPLSSHLLFGTSTVSALPYTGPQSCSMEASAGTMRTTAASLRDADSMRPETADPVPSSSFLRSRHPLTRGELQRDGGNRPDRPVGVRAVIPDSRRGRQKYEVRCAIYIPRLYSTKVPRGSAPIQLPLVEDVMARGADMAAYCWARLVERRLDKAKRSEVSLWARDQRLNVSSNTSFSGTSGSVVLALALLQLITECTFTADTVVTGEVAMDGGIGAVSLIPEKLEGSKEWATKFIYPLENFYEVLDMEPVRRAGVLVCGVPNMTEVVRASVTGWWDIDLTIEGTDLACTFTSVPDGTGLPHAMEVQACVLPGSGKVECSGNVSSLTKGEIEHAREWVVENEEKLLSFLQVKLGKPVVKVVDLNAMRVTPFHADADEYQHNGDIPSGSLDLFVNFTRQATRKDEYWFTASLIQVFVALMTGLRLPKTQLAISAIPYPGTGYLGQGCDISPDDVTRCRELGVQRLGIPASRYDRCLGWDEVRALYAGDMQLLRIDNILDVIELSFCK